MSKHGRGSKHQTFHNKSGKRTAMGKGGKSGTQLPGTSGNKLSSEGGKSMSKKNEGQYAGNRDTTRSSFGGDSLDV